MSNVYLAGHTGYQFTRTKGAPVEPFAPNDCPQSLRNAFLDFFRPRSNSFKSLCLSSEWSTCSRLLALRPSACNQKRGSVRLLAWRLRSLEHACAGWPALGLRLGVLRRRSAFGMGYIPLQRAGSQPAEEEMEKQIRPDCGARRARLVPVVFAGESRPKFQHVLHASD